MNGKVMGGLMLVALQLLALFAGKDTSIFAAEMAIVIAMPEQVK